LHLGDYENALKCFQKATLMQENFGIAYLNWGLALYLQGKKEEAVGMFARAFQMGGLYMGSYEREVHMLKEDLKRGE